MTKMPTLNERGHEILDPTPVAIPVGFKKPLSLEERMIRFIRSERVRAHLDQSGHETFEEADDFNVGEDFDPVSPYEEHFDHLQNYENDKAARAARSRPNKKFEEETPSEQKKAPDRKEPKKRAKAQAPTQTDIKDFISDSEDE